MPPVPVMAPAKLVFCTSPNASVFAPSETVEPAAPDRLPTVRLPAAALRSKAAPAPSVTAPVGARLPLPASASTPPLMAVPPV